MASGLPELGSGLLYCVSMEKERWDAVAHREGAIREGLRLSHLVNKPIHSPLAKQRSFLPRRVGFHLLSVFPSLVFHQCFMVMWVGKTKISGSTLLGHRLRGILYQEKVKETRDTVSLWLWWWPHETSPNTDTGLHLRFADEVTISALCV